MSWEFYIWMGKMSVSACPLVGGNVSGSSAAVWHTCSWAHRPKHSCQLCNATQSEWSTQWTTTPVRRLIVLTGLCCLSSCLDTQPDTGRRVDSVQCAHCQGQDSSLPFDSPPLPTTELEFFKILQYSRPVGVCQEGHTLFHWRSIEDGRQVVRQQHCTSPLLNTFQYIF